ncbi:MAG TPA: phosphate ABC transporter permease subunit PstC [Myxococcota bacterium]|nr:phosphate ABC transporter permease subunit PstC [Myxococcota bacterium]
MATPGLDLISMRERIVRKFVELMLAFMGIASVLITIGVLYVLLSNTWAFFLEVSPKAFFLDTVWTPLFSTQRFGIWALVVGSLLVTAVAMFTAAPLGILAAIYMSEFAKPTLRRALKPLLEILAGIPTVVYGYFALTIVTPALMPLIPGLNGFNALAPGLVMGLMLVPTISSLCEDALHKTPRDLKEAAYSLGARKLSTIFLVILPYSRSTIIAALFLAFGRAMGETMIVAIASGLKPNLTLDVREPIQTMTAYIVQVSMGDTPQQSIEYLTIFAVGFMLFVLTFVFHAGSRVILRSKFKVKS